MEKKLFVVVHYIYEDLCGDSYYGKSGTQVSQDFVFDTEENVSNAVDILNKRNHSYRATEPEDDWDDSWMDEDYFYYKEFNPKSITIEELIEKRG